VSKRRPNAAGGCRTPGQFVRIRCPSWCASFWSAAVPCRFLAVANCGTVDVQCGGSWKAFLRPGPRETRGCEAYIEGRVLELGSKAGRKELDAQWRELRRGSGSRTGGRNGGRSSWPGWVRVLNILKSGATCKDYRTDPFNVSSAFQRKSSRNAVGSSASSLMKRAPSQPILKGGDLRRGRSSSSSPFDKSW